MIDSNKISEMISSRYYDIEVVPAKSENMHIANLCLDNRTDFAEFMRYLRDTPELLFNQLIDITAVDYLGKRKRFELVYLLLSINYNKRIAVKVKADESETVPSLVNVFSVADWMEREVWDMYGIIFSDHNDLRRILTDYGFEGHPLRKDFPLTGYTEVRYSAEHCKVIYEPLNLQQAFRQFDFETPWEGTNYILPGDEKATK